MECTEEQVSYCERLCLTQQSGKPNEREIGHNGTKQGNGLTVPFVFLMNLTAKACPGPNARELISLKGRTEELGRVAPLDSQRQ
jgi:hypothetical protein